MPYQNTSRSWTNIHVLDHELTEGNQTLAQLDRRYFNWSQIKISNEISNKIFCKNNFELFHSNKRGDNVIVNKTWKHNRKFLSQGWIKFKNLDTDEDSSKKSKEKESRFERMNC